eukprot:3277272-Amphidinium_carterae.1
MVYVDGLLLIGEDDEVKDVINRPEQQLQLQHVTKQQRHQPLVCLGRRIDYYGNHIALSMTKDYCDSLPSLSNIQSNTNTLATTGNKWPPIETNTYNESRGALVGPGHLPGLALCKAP